MRASCWERQPGHRGRGKPLRGNEKGWIYPSVAGPTPQTKTRTTREGDARFQAERPLCLNPEPVMRDT